MDNTDVKVLSAMEYFLTRKKTIERYVEGEHKWFGDVSVGRDITYVDDPTPWYLDNNTGSKSQVCSKSQ